MTDPREVRRIVRVETIISMAINAFIPSAVIWLLEVTPPARLGGATGLVQGMMKGSGLATFVMTLILTTILHVRMRGGSLPAIARVEGPGRVLPRPLILRAVIMALAAMILLVPIGAALVALLRILPLDRTGLLLFNIVFGALVGFAMTAPVVRRALADPVRRAA